MPRGVPKPKENGKMDENTTTTQARKEDISGISFFSSVDIDPRTNKVSSEFPAWFFTQQIETMNEEIRSIEYRLENGDVPPANVPYYRNQLRRLRERKDSIDASRPKMNAAQKDGLAKALTDLGEVIAESLFTRADMERGIADAHEEARRMSTPCIKVNPDFARQFGINPVQGKVTRNDAVKMWKIGRRALGEEVNVEALRR